MKKRQTLLSSTVVALFMNSDLRFDTDVSYFQIFELLLCFCSIEGVRSRISRSVLSTLDFNGRQQFSDMLIGPVNQVKEPLLATVHWAQQSPDTHDEAPLYALDFLTEIYEVSSKFYEYVFDVCLWF